MIRLRQAISFTVGVSCISGGHSADGMIAGILNSKIVGVQYYTGYASVGEYVLVRREPRNSYDSNALRVENVQRDQIGHIPRTVAATLAKYMVRYSVPEGSQCTNSFLLGLWGIAG